MDFNDEQLEQVLSNLRRQKPELQQAELLTENTLSKISKISVRSSYTLLFWVRAISGAVAAFLLTLLIYQHSDNKLVESTYSYNYNVKRELRIESDCIQMDENKKINLVKTYSCYQKLNSLKNKQMQIFYQQFNNQKHEINN